jgi:hypothetical protein
LDKKLAILAQIIIKKLAEKVSGFYKKTPIFSEKVTYV